MFSSIEKHINPTVFLPDTMKKKKAKPIPAFKMEKRIREINGSYYLLLPRGWITNNLINMMTLYWVKFTREYPEEVEENE